MRSRRGERERTGSGVTRLEPSADDRRTTPRIVPPSASELVGLAARDDIVVTRAEAEELAPVVAHPRRPHRAVCPCRRCPRLQPVHCVVGVRPAGRTPALGHRHLRPVYLAVQAGGGGRPGRPRSPTHQCLRSLPRVVATRTSPPAHHGRPQHADPAVPPRPQPDRTALDRGSTPVPFGIPPS